MSNEFLITLTDGDFAKETSSGVVLVDFWADWCGPCRMIGPFIDQLAAEYAGRAKICKLNIDEYETVAAANGVMSIPTLLVFKDGKEVERLVGVRPKPELAAVLDKHLS